MSSSVIKLLKSGILVIALVFISACGESTKTDEQFVLDAQKLYEQKDVKAAVVELKNALQKNGNNAEARALLGRIYMVLGQGAAAEKELDRARELGVSFLDVAAELGGALLHQGKADALIEEFQLGKYDSADLRAIKTVLIGEAFFQKQLFPAAGRYFNSSLVNDALKSRALQGNALVALTKGDFNSAQAFVEQAVSIASETPRVWVTVADVHLAKGETKKAIFAYEKAAEFSHSNLDYFYQMAMRGIMKEHLKNNDERLAEKVFNELKNSFSGQQPIQDLELLHLRAVLAYQQGSYEKASELASKLLYFEKNHLGALLLAGTTDAIAGRYEQAEKLLGRFLSAMPKHTAARKILAYVQSGSQQPQEVIKTLTPLVQGEVKPDAEAIAMVAYASLQVGEAKQGSQYLRKALEQTPDDMLLRFSLAQSLVAQKNFEEAIQELLMLKGAEGLNAQALLSIAETYIRARNYSDALEALVQLQEMVPANPMPVSLQGTVYHLMGNDAAAKSMLLDALKVDSSYVPAKRYLAFLALQSDDISGAESLYLSAMEGSPDNVNIILDYSNLLLQQGRLSSAESLLKQAQTLNGDEVRVATLLARIYLKQQKPAVAVSELMALDGNLDSGGFSELGNAQMMLGEYNSALDSYKKLAELEINSAIPHYLIATAYLAINDIDSADEALSLSLQRDNKFTPSLIASLKISLKKGDLSNVRESLRKIELTGTGSVSVSLIKAELAMRENKPLVAAKIYESLYLSNQGNFLLKKLVRSLWASGQREQVLALLDKVSLEQPSNFQALYLKATAYEEQGEYAEAIDLYRRVVELNNEHYIALNNLAWLLKDSNPEEALSFANRAYSLSPHNAAIKDTIREIKGSINH